MNLSEIVTDRFAHVRFAPDRFALNRFAHDRFALTKLALNCLEKTVPYLQSWINISAICASVR